MGVGGGRRLLAQKKNVNEEKSAGRVEKMNVSSFLSLYSFLSLPDFYSGRNAYSKKKSNIARGREREMRLYKRNLIAVGSEKNDNISRERKKEVIALI